MSTLTIFNLDDALTTYSIAAIAAMKGIGLKSIAAANDRTKSVVVHELVRVFLEVKYDLNSNLGEIKRLRMSLTPLIKKYLDVSPIEEKINKIKFVNEKYKCILEYIDCVLITYVENNKLGIKTFLSSFQMLDKDIQYRFHNDIISAYDRIKQYGTCDRHLLSDSTVDYVTEDGEVFEDMEAEYPYLYLG